MKILVVQETDWIRRNPIQHHHLLELLSRRGHQVTVIDHDILWHEDRAGGLVQRRSELPEVHRLYPGASVRLVRPGMLRLPGVSRISWLAGCRSELRRLLREDRPDIIVAYGISNAYLAARLARRGRIPFVFHVLDALHTLAEPAFLQPVAKRVERAVFGRADRIIVANRRLEEYARDMGARADRIEYLPAGSDLAHFRPDIDRAPARQDYGLAPQDQALLFMGWLYPFCGLKEMAARLPALAERYPGLRLLVAGEGPLFDDLRSLSSRPELREHFRLLGQVAYADLPRLLAAADICLLPFAESPITRYVVPMKLYDYLAAGKPVVANRLPGVAAEFSEEDGVVFADGPEQVLWEALILALDQARVTELGRAARRRMESNGDWETAADRFESLLLAAVKRAGPRERAPG